MQVQIKRDELLKGLAIVEKALPAKTVLDSLKGIKIEARNNTLQLTASKQDLGITYTVISDYEINEPGTVILPGHYLISIIRKTYEEYITISSEDQTTLIQTSRSKIQLTGYDITTYPEISYEIDADNLINIDSDVFINAYNQTKYAIAQNNARPLLTGINFAFSADGLRVGSTDARRLAICNYPEINNAETTFTINRNLLSDIIRILELSKCSSLNLNNNANQIIIKTEQLMLKARLLDGQYPDLNRLIPSGANYSYEVISRELLLVLEKIVLLSEKDSSNVTTEIIDDNVLLKSGFKDLGAMEEYCSLHNLNGTPFPISFDPKFLLDAINALGAERLRISMVDEISAFKIEDINSQDNLQVISPIRMG